MVFGWKSIQKMCFFTNKWIILFSFWGETTNFIGGLCIIFKVFFHLVILHEPQTYMMAYGCWKNVSYVPLCTLILSNPFHLTIISRLTLILNELWVPKFSHANSLLIGLHWQNIWNIKNNEFFNHLKDNITKLPFIFTYNTTLLHMNYWIYWPK
jgi:hypothetical protein